MLYLENEEKRARITYLESSFDTERIVRDRYELFHLFSSGIYVEWKKWDFHLIWIQILLNIVWIKLKYFAYSVALLNFLPCSWT